LNQRDPTPWLGTKVLVIKKGHPRKGQPAVVRDVRPGRSIASGLEVGILPNSGPKGVLPKQSSPSGLKIVVQFEIYDPNVLCPRETFEYDDLVEFEYVFKTMSTPRS
jgi:hypothetical protein